MRKTPRAYTNCRVDTTSDMKRTRCSSAPPQKQRSRTNTRTDAGEIEDNEGDYVTIKRSEWESANEGLRLLQQVYNKVRVSMTIYLWKQPTPSATT